MKALLIIKNLHSKFSFHSLNKRMTLVGDSPDFDVTITSLGKISFSILQEEKGIKVLALEDSGNKIKGNLNKLFTEAQTFKVNNLEFILIPDLNLDSLINTKVDWKPENLPMNPTASDYPERLLQFILNSTGLSSGALFHLKNNHLRMINSEKMEMTDKTEFLIKEFIHQNAHQTIINVNFETHSLLFKANQVMGQFLLIKTPVSAEESFFLYMPKPIEQSIPEGVLQTLLLLTINSLSLHVLKNEERKRRLDYNEQSKTDGMIWGKNAQMLRIREMLEKLAPTDLSLFIHGETGTGKELLAQYISSKSKTSPLVTVNCAAIPKDLAESFLFGHKKGAFTGALIDQKGKIEEADGGILFLDEIADLSLEIQAKILRVMQDKIVTPLGGKEKKVKVRLIAASHKDLMSEVRHGRFREDLFYRLNEVTVHLPALRERKEDILYYAQTFLTEVCAHNRLPEKTLNPGAQNFLLESPWRGNLRELKSLMRKVGLLISEELITKNHLKEFLTDKNAIKESTLPFNLEEAKKIFMENQLKRALSEAQGNRTQAAKLLGISSRTMFRLMADSGYDISGIETDDYGRQLHSTH
ncbi:MAG: sigma 54-interacting transcriptional regulator [Bacteriovoracaceae bacterium]